MADPITRLRAALKDRYRIERQLGEGGMATVYLARDLKHNRSVALKALKPELAAVVGGERFLAEIRTTATLQHPNILPLFDSGEADGILYYVMPHVEGESLRDRLDREKQLPVDEAVRIAISVAEALAYAHSRGVIHRDVKPANILLQAGKPVVSDFGIALAVSVGGGARLTETGLSLGTPHYMSPEQATGDLPVGAASDVYSLGCVLFEMLLGEPPYTGGTAQAILGKIIAGTADRVSERRPSVPANVDAAIRCALAKVPADRFATANDFARALADAAFRVDEVAGLAAGSSAGPWRSVALVLGLVALASTITLAVVVASYGSRTPPPVTHLAFNLPEGDLLSAGDRNSPGLALSPDGQHLVYIGRRDGVDRLYHRALDSEQVTEIPGTEGAAGPFFAPDGAAVGFFVGTELRRTPLVGGAPVLVTTLPDNAHGATWGPDDAIYFGLHESSIWQVSAQGGAPQPLSTLERDADPPEVDHKMPQLLPDGRGVLFEVQTGLDDQSYVAVHDTRADARRRLVTGANPWYVPTGHLLFTQGGSLWAVRFDLDELAAVGEPIVVVENVSINPTGGAAQLAVAPEGTLVFASGGPAALRRLVRVDREGRATELLQGLADYGIPRVSPDGERLAVNIGGFIWIVDLERLARTRLNSAGTAGVTPFTWTGDSRGITFSDRSAANRAIVTVASDGAGEPELVLADEINVFPGSWSPDGQSLAYYVNDPETNRDIWIWSRTNGAATPFVRTAFEDVSPVFSPEGSLLAYVSDLSGRLEVYLEPYPSGGGRVTVSTDGGVEPVWSRDGGMLYYRTGRDVLAVEVTTAEALRIGEPRLLFSNAEYVMQADFSGVGTTAFYDVLPGDQGLVMVESGEGEGAATRIHVVRNWLRELEERIPR